MKRNEERKKKECLFRVPYNNREMQQNNRNDDSNRHTKITIIKQNQNSNFTGNKAAQAEQKKISKQQ